MASGALVATRVKYSEMSAEALLDQALCPHATVGTIDIDVSVKHTEPHTYLNTYPRGANEWHSAESQMHGFTPHSEVPQGR